MQKIFIKNISKIHSMMRTQLFQNTIWMVTGFGIKLLFQFFYFIIVARTLRPTEYGTFAGALGLVVFISPFVTWGSGFILIKNVSRDRTLFSKYWGSSIIFLILTAALFSFVTIAIGLLLVPSKIFMPILFFQVVGEFFGTRLCDLAGQALTAVNRMKYSSHLQSLHGGIRFFAAVILVVVIKQPDALTWSILYMLSGLSAGIIGFLLVEKIVGHGIYDISSIPSDIKEGFLFSIGYSASGLNNDIDKTLLLRLAGETTAGIYSVAYRFIDAAYIPSRAFFTANGPRFFQKGATGIRDSMAYAKKLAPWSALIGLCCSMFLLAFRPFFTLLLGEEYHNLSYIVSWLAIVPLLRSISSLPASTLTGAEYQSHRSYIQVLIAVINICSNLILIPKFGWLGAVWSTILSEICLAILLWIVTLIICKKQIT